MNCHPDVLELWPDFLSDSGHTDTSERRAHFKGAANLTPTGLSRKKATVLLSTSLAWPAWAGCGWAKYFLKTWQPTFRLNPVELPKHDHQRKASTLESCQWTKPPYRKRHPAAHEGPPCLSFSVCLLKQDIKLHKMHNAIFPAPGRWLLKGCRRKMHRMQIENSANSGER